jgi:hypothetical protein
MIPTGKLRPDCRRVMADQQVSAIQIRGFVTLIRRRSDAETLNFPFTMFKLKAVLLPRAGTQRVLHQNAEQRDVGMLMALVASRFSLQRRSLG